MESPNLKQFVGMNVGKGPMRRFIYNGVLSSKVRKSLTAAGEDPRQQVVIEVLHMVLNHVENALLLLKVLVNKHIKRLSDGQPECKTAAVVALWKNASKDNTKEMKAWFHPISRG